MKKFIKPCIFALALSLCVGSSVLSFKSTEEPTKLDASYSGSISISNSWAEAPSNDDPAATNYNRYNPTNRNAGFSFTVNGNTLNITASSNKTSFGYYSVMVSLVMTQAAYTHGDYNISCSASATNTTSGQSDHMIEAYANPNVYAVGGNPGSASNGTFRYDPDDYSTASSGALFRASGRGNGTVNASTSSATTFNVENKTNSSNNYFIYYFISGYRECSNGNTAYSASVTFTVSQTTNIPYTIYNETIGSYHDTLSGALDNINSNYSGYQSHTLTMLANASVDIWSVKEMKTGFSLDLKGHSFSYTGETLGALVICRQANGLLGARSFSVTSTGGAGSISGSFTDSVFLMGGDKGTHTVTFYVGPNVTIQNTSSLGRGISCHATCKLSIDHDATIRANGNAVYVNASPAGDVNIKGILISNNYYALYLNSCDTNSYIGLAGSNLSLQSGTGLPSIYVNFSQTMVTFYGNATVNSINTLLDASSDPISIQFANNPADNAKIVVLNVGNNDAASLFSVVNQSSSHHLELSNNNLYYKLNNYSISFNANGGSGSMGQVSRDHGASYTLPACTFTAPSGKAFIGWKVNNSGNLLAAGSSYTVTANVTLYAQWQNVYTVTYSAGANGSGSYAHSNQLSGSYTLLDFASLTGVSAATGYRFKNYTVDGVDKNPGDTITLSSAKTVTVNFEINPVNYVSGLLTTRSSLAYHYSKDGEGNFAFTSLYLRFGGIIAKDLWDLLDDESEIVAYGELYSTAEYIGANELKTYYASADSDDSVEKKYYEVTADPASLPVLFNDSEYMGVTDDYYVWNLRKSVSEANYTTVYSSVAFIVTNNNGVVFLQETRKSVKSVAQDLIDGPDYNVSSLDGSLNYLATLA